MVSFAFSHQFGVWYFLLLHVWLLVSIVRQRPNGSNEVVRDVVRLEVSVGNRRLRLQSDEITLFNTDLCDKRVFVCSAVPVVLWRNQVYRKETSDKHAGGRVERPPQTKISPAAPHQRIHNHFALPQGNRLDKDRHTVYTHMLNKDLCMHVVYRKQFECKSYI